jgi:4-hydroxybenzoyl-CoA thioesterase/acyl-CoA thioester hydrolase
MPKPFVSHRRVEFRDTDAAGIMHFSVFFTCMEQVEHEFLRSLGTSVVTPLTGPDAPPGSKLSWPRVAAECQYSGSARFEDELEIELHVAQLGTSSITYQFQFRVAGRRIATGSLTTVCCQFLPGHAPAKQPIPASLRQLLEAE